MQRQPRQQPRDRSNRQQQRRTKQPTFSKIWIKTSRSNQLRDQNRGYFDLVSFSSKCTSTPKYKTNTTLSNIWQWQWQWQWQSWHVDNNTAAECGLVIANARWELGPGQQATPLHQHNTPQQLQLEHNPAMAITIVTRRQQHCSGLQTGNWHGGVANGLDRGRVDVVVDVVRMPTRDTLAFQVLVLKATPRWNASLVVSSNIVLAVEHGAANTITKLAIALGHQQGTRPCRTPGIIQ